VQVSPTNSPTEWQRQYRAHSEASRHILTEPAAE